MRRFSGRDVGGLFISLFGIAILFSAVLNNPWLGKFWLGPSALDRLDVLEVYFWWSLPLGFLVILLGSVFAKAPKLDGAVMIALCLVAVVLGDRFLLSKKGLPLWVYDTHLRYRHRPGAVRMVDPSNPGLLVRINSLGHHDEEMPIAKPQGEQRGVFLGDSVTMGYGVSREQTFAAHLEQLLDERDTRFRTHQMINTGVHGYSTSQELVVMKESLQFEPDFVALGFCMNDVTEPFIVDSELGGVGLDYHGVSQTPSPAIGWLLNETGVGRVVQGMQARGKTKEKEKLGELYDVRAMALGSRTEPRFKEAWTYVLGSLEHVYQEAAQTKRPFLLMIFPFTFQLLGEPGLLTPQAILTEHAAKHGIPVLDFTPIMRDVIYDDPELLEVLRRKNNGPAQIQAFYQWKIDKYFYDEDHFTSEGNQVVAEQIYRWMAQKGLITPKVPLDSPVGTSTASASPSMIPREE